MFLIWFFYFEAKISNQTLFTCTYLLFEYFMALLETLTSNLSDLLKHTVLVPLQKSDMSHVQCEFLQEPAGFFQWKQTAGPHWWVTLFFSIHYPSLNTKMHKSPPILQPVKRCETHFRVFHWAMTDSKSKSKAADFMSVATNITR